MLRIFYVLHKAQNAHRVGPQFRISWRTFGAQGHEKTPQSMTDYGKSKPANH
jgi:hypothetical protein